MGGDEQHWACAECARKCFKVHGRSFPPSHLSFFKVMLGQFKKSLFVPPKFARLLGNLVGQNIYLENSDGLRWEVKLLKVDDRLAFQQGWNEFAAYHSIQVGEILVFKYTSTSSFIVQIFGTSGCERSHFCESIDSDMHKRCPTDCLCFCKDGRKNDTYVARSCIGDKVPSKKNNAIRTTPCESFSSPHLHCKTDGDFHKRKRSAAEYLCPHKDGSKHDKSAVHLCTKDKDSARKRKAIRTTSCEILSAPMCAGEDMWGDSNIPQPFSSHNMNDISGAQTAMAVDYSEIPCFAVSEDADKGQEKKQMAPTNVCANVDVSPVSNDAEKGQEGSQMAPTGMCANVNMNQVDPPELPCKLSKTHLWKEEEMIVTLPSEFVSTKVGTENADKSMIIEEKSFYCTNSKVSQTSCGEELKGNESALPTANNVANITRSFTEMGISLTSCLEVPPISSETKSSEELGCKNLVVELPMSGLSNENVVPEEDKTAAAKDDILDKASTSNNFVSCQNMPSLKCSGDAGENLSPYDMATYRFLLDEEGTCYIVQNTIGNPGSNNTSSNLSNNDMDDAKCKVTFSPTAKEISFRHDIVSKDLCSAPIVENRNDENSNETALIATANNVYHARNGHLDTMGSNAPAISEQNDALSVGDAPQHMSNLPKSQEGSDTTSGSREHGVKQDATLQKNEKFMPYLKEPVLKAVKTEIMDPDDLSSPNSTYFSFSLVVNTLSWHELFEPLPSNCGRWRLERKVVLLRDPAMRAWPVLYHESFRFIGFLGGWDAFVTANNIRKGDICHFETASHMESVLQVQISRAPDV